MELARLRKKIDKIDEQLIKNLAKRQEIVREIGLIKNKSKIMVYDKTRERELISLRKRLAKKHSLDENFVEKLFKAVINESKRIQKK